jgi:hypothetical protein
MEKETPIKKWMQESLKISDRVYCEPWEINENQDGRYVKNIEKERLTIIDIKPNDILLRGNILTNQEGANRTIDVNLPKHKIYRKTDLDLLQYLGLAGIDDPAKWVEEMKDENKLLKRVLKSTDDSLTCISWDDDGPPIRLKLDAQIKQLQAENEKLKKALGRIYTMDTSFENYINAIVELKQIAGDAIK